MSLRREGSPNSAVYSRPVLGSVLTTLSTRLAANFPRWSSHVIWEAAYFDRIALAVVLWMLASVLSNDQYMAQCRWPNQPRFEAHL